MNNKRFIMTSYKRITKVWIETSHFGYFVYYAYTTENSNNEVCHKGFYTKFFAMRCFKKFIKHGNDIINKKTFGVVVAKWNACLPFPISPN